VASIPYSEHSLCTLLPIYLPGDTQSPFFPDNPLKWSKWRDVVPPPRPLRYHFTPSAFGEKNLVSALKSTSNIL